MSLKTSVPYAAIAALLLLSFLSCTARGENYQWICAGYHNTFGNDTADFTTADWWKNGAIPVNDPAAVVNLAPDMEIDWPNHDGAFYQPQIIVLPSSGVTWARVTTNTPSQILIAKTHDVMSSVGDPSAFTGLWAFRSPRNGLRFTGLEENPLLQIVEGGNWSRFEVSEENGSATIQSLTSGGVFEKTGAGMLRVTAPVEPDTTCFLQSGTLTIGREPMALPTSVIDGAVAHFDASKESALETVLGPDGRAYVTKWTDADEPGRYASQCVNTWDVQGEIGHPSFPLPFVTTNAASGMPLVDFGAKYSVATETYANPGEENVFGPAGVLEMSSGAANVVELFLVVEETSIGSSGLYPVGGFYSYAWILMADPGGDTFCLGMGDVNAGSWYVNGVRKTRFSYPIPRQLVVLSVKGWYNGRSFNWLGGMTRGRDGNGVSSAEFGGLRIGELVAYNKYLTDEERRANMRFLMNKWLPGREGREWDMGTVCVRSDESQAVNVEAGKKAFVRRLHTCESMAQNNSSHTFRKIGDGVLAFDTVSSPDMNIQVDGGSLELLANDTDVVSTDAPASDAWVHFDATAPDTVVTEDNRVTEWKDCRTGSVMRALPRVPDADVAAVYEATGPDGKNVVNFGDFTEGRQAGMFFYTGDSVVYDWESKAYDTFVVMKKYDDENKICPVFSSSTWNFVNFQGSLFSCDRDIPSVQGAFYSCDGRFTYGDHSFDLHARDGFHVLGMHPVSPVSANALAVWVNNNGGGLSIGEYISYRRRLTDKERQDTIAYLMNKWGLGTHPETHVQKVGTITFAADVRPELIVDGTRVAASVVSQAASPATFVKSGPGMLSVATLVNIATLDVSDGALFVTDADASTTLSGLSAPVNCYSNRIPSMVFTGSVALTPTGTVNIALPAGKPAYGRYPILSAGTLTGAENVPSWKVSVTGGEESTRIRLRAMDNALYYEITRVGCTLILR